MHTASEIIFAAELTDAANARAAAAEARCIELEKEISILRQSARGLAAWLPERPIVFNLDRTPPRIYERGPGIAAKTDNRDNSVAHLDEDLLCEDA